MRLLLLSLTALALMARSAQAQSLLNFDFTTTGIGGSITGEIIGLSSSGSSTPTEIVIFTQPAGYTYAPMALLANGYNFLPGDDTFTVTSGAITVANVGIYKNIGTGGDAQGYGFNVTYGPYTGANGIYQIIGSTVTTSANTSGFAGTTYTAAVPEPRETMALFLLIGVGLLMARKIRERIAG